jgi:hypothetical protein
LFEKDLTKPLVLQQHEALLRRLAETHAIRADVEAKKEKLKAGFNGEKTINYFLGLLPSKNYHIFHNIRLPAEQGFFEIDIYLLSPKCSFIIEGKNYSGTLYLERNQLIQEVNGGKRVYENPIVQVNRHKILLKYWFEKNQLPFPPLEHFVCFSNTSSTINIAPDYVEAEKRVCKAVDIIRKINEFERIYKKEVYDQKDIRKIKKSIISQHNPRRMDLFKEYGIDKKDVPTGVQCPECPSIQMNYNHGCWECPKCHFRSRDAHLQAINDYFLIFGTTITNSEMREFLHLPSSRAATNLFSHLELPHTGNTKDRVYFQTHENLHPGRP